MNRKFRLSLVAAVVIAALIMAFGAHAPAMGQDEVKITILHLNDVHGRMDAFKPSGATEEVGGLSKVALLVREMRAKATNEILLLSAGDMIHGTNVVNLFGGQPMIEVMNDMGFAAMTLGNHEFNYGQERLLFLQSIAKFPFLAANVVKAGTGAPLATPYVVETVAGVRIGMFGLSPMDTPIVTHPMNVVGLKFLDPVKVAAEMVETIRGQADIVLCLSHLGYAEDKALAAAVPG
ncbi:MAG: bifunctional metallophosphatase/5'-nucleotidase, partial [Firmicutes bacterium]|nr:bifunctional metallophosphatase/5'-nucleotidase [Bacillota bacterium]